MGDDLDRDRELVELLDVEVRYLRDNRARTEQGLLLCGPNPSCVLSESGRMLVNLDDGLCEAYDLSRYRAIIWLKAVRDGKMLGPYDAYRAHLEDPERRARAKAASSERRQKRAMLAQSHVQGRTAADLALGDD